MEIIGNYLHLRLRRTKKEIPYHKNISSTKYPRQNVGFINQRINVYVNDAYRFHPEDDPEYVKEGEPQILLATCKVVRFDAEEPFIAVYVSEDYDFVITDSSLSPSRYPLINAIQNDKLCDDVIGSYGTLQSGMVFNDRMLDTFDFDGVVIASSLSEPAIDVIIGRYSDEEYKVYLSSEVWLDVKGNIIDDDSGMSAKSKTREVRRQVMEGKIPYGLNEN